MDLHLDGNSLAHDIDFAVVGLKNINRFRNGWGRKVRCDLSSPWYKREKVRLERYSQNRRVASELAARKPKINLDSISTGVGFNYSRHESQESELPSKLSFLRARLRVIEASRNLVTPKIVECQGTDGRVYSLHVYSPQLTGVICEGDVLDVQCYSDAEMANLFYIDGYGSLKVVNVGEK